MADGIRGSAIARGQPAGPVGTYTALSPRERDVAGLIAEGLSNRDIGTRLHMSERTVENHVSRILRKLQLSSRTAIAAWATRSAMP
jgi:DNA-binding NarL/FixJ family response regulator